MKIVKFEAENVKRLSAVEITPDGSLVVVGGANEAGKTSVLDSIWYALGGEKAVCDKPLRNGQKKGFVRLDLGEFVVERTFTEKGSKLEVRSKDGFAAKSPQAILDGLCGSMAFDPLEFSRMKPRDQLATLRELVGLDFTKLDAERATAFAERTNKNRSGQGGSD